MRASLLVVLALATLASCVTANLDPFGLRGETVLTLGIFRHGIRSPQAPPPSMGRDVTINNFTSKEFPLWSDSTKSHPAGKGNLTPQGWAVFEKFGDWFRRFWTKIYQSPEQSCKMAGDWSHIYVDIATRCQNSSQAWWNGFAPHCDNVNTTVQPADKSGKKTYPGITLFKHHPTGFDLPDCTGNSNDTIGGGNATRRQQWMMEVFQDEIKLLNDILGGPSAIDPAICNKQPGETCTFFDIPIEKPDWTDSQYYRGPFGYASYFSNYFLTQYFDNQKTAWGLLETEKFDFRNVLRMARVHYAEDIMATSAGAASRSYGSELFAHILASIEQASDGKPVDVDSIEHAPDTKLLTYFGHHENVNYITKFLDTQFMSRGNDLLWSPYTAGVFFRLYDFKDTGSLEIERYIEVFYITPTADQQRNIEDVDFDTDPPSFERLQLSWCSQPSGFTCKYKDFKRIAYTRLKEKCIYDSTLKYFFLKKIRESWLDYFEEQEL